MKKTCLYYFLTFSLFSFSDCKCKKDNLTPADNTYGLPNATQTGAMIFACRINGQNRIAGPGLFSQNGKIAYDSASAFCDFGDVNYFEHVTMIVYGSVKINIPYSLSDTIQSRFLYGTDSTCNGISSDVVVINGAFGTVTFTRLDSTNKIISGVFAFKVAIPGCDTLNFTDGRFDVIF